jgi:hypothetical protein
VTDLAVKENNLIAATQGRGLWILDDLSLIHQSTAYQRANNPILFTPIESYRMPGSQSKNVVGAGTNHPGGVMTYFFLPELDEKKDTVSLTFKESDNTVIKKFSTHAKEKNKKLEVKKGSNHFVWNMKYEDAKRFDGMIFWAGSLSGPTAVPGNYRVIMETGSWVDSAYFSILKNPASDGTIQDIQAQFDFVQSVSDKVTEAHQAIIDIRKIRNQINDFTSRIEDKEIKSYADSIDLILTEVENNLYQTKNRSGQDPLNFPIKLTNKLAALNSLTQMGGGDYPPTAAAIQVRDEITSKINVELEKFEKVKGSMIQELNDLIDRKEIRTIIIDK